MGTIFSRNVTEPRDPSIPGHVDHPIHVNEEAVPIPPEVSEYTRALESIPFELPSEPPTAPSVRYPIQELESIPFEFPPMSSMEPPVSPETEPPVPPELPPVISTAPPVPPELPPMIPPAPPVPLEPTVLPPAPSAPMPVTPDREDHARLRLVASSVKPFNGRTAEFPRWKSYTECVFNGTGYEKILTDAPYAALHPAKNTLVYSQLSMALSEGDASHIVHMYKDTQDGHQAWQDLLDPREVLEPHVKFAANLHAYFLPKA
jgi:hypothetical protein